MKSRHSLLAAAVALTLAVPLAQADPRLDGEVVVDGHATDHASVRITRVVAGLEHPWAVNWLPDGRMVVTERPGRMWVSDGERLQRLDGLPPVHAHPENRGQSGLMDVVAHPDHADNGWIYFTYSSPGDPDSVTSDDDRGTGVVLARARINDAGDALTDLETVYAQNPRHNPGRHYGSRIVFLGDGTVLFSIGDRGLRGPAQDLTDPSGSMIRVNDGGGAAEGNPFIGVPPGNLRPEIWSFGHRNNQGIAMHPETGELWTTEHGPQGGDLLHRLQVGANYGWPQVAFGTEYRTGEQVGIGRSAPGVTPPVHVWEESMAPSGLAFYTGSAIPAWNGHLFAGALAKKQVHRLELDGDRVVSEELLFTDAIGRIRDVRMGPDGHLYLVTDEADGGVYRVEPAG